MRSGEFSFKYKRCFGKVTYIFYGSLSFLLLIIVPLFMNKLSVQWAPCARSSSRPRRQVENKMDQDPALTFQQCVHMLVYGGWQRTSKQFQAVIKCWKDIQWVWWGSGGTFFRKLVKKGKWWAIPAEIRTAIRAEIVFSLFWVLGWLQNLTLAVISWTW